MNEVHIIAPSVNFGSLVSQIPGFGSLGFGGGLSLGFQQVCQVRFRVGRVQGIMQISEGPEGIILESMLEGYAEYYSAELSQKIHRGQKENALKCRNNGGNIPLGYVVGQRRAGG